MEESGKPLDPIKAFRLEHGKKVEMSPEIIEPESLKNIPDIQVIKNIIIKEHSKRI